MKSRRSKTLHETVELNITAFLNLMVILVPFLLITAVFSRMTVLELNLPQLDAEADKPKEEQLKLELQLLIYPNFLDLRDANLGRLGKFEIEEQSINWKPITQLLLEIKRRYPDETGIALLLHKEVPYKRLIEVMDKVRSAQLVVVTDVEEYELFPDVSVGKAPEVEQISEELKSIDDLPLNSTSNDDPQGSVNSQEGVQ